jgi:hypothetical protein
MTFNPHIHPLPARRLGRAGAPGAARTLRLLSSGDGWALIDARGRVVYSALGISGRRRCLQYARSEGIGTLLS